MLRKLCRVLGPRRPTRPLTRVRLALEALEQRLAPSANVLTFHNDLTSSGLNPNETQLTPANVQVGSFGKLFTTSVDGQVYAQPLVDSGVTIAAGPHTSPGAAGVHDVVFVATEHDSLYAIDASSSGGAVLWKRSFLDSADPTDNTLGATAISTLSTSDVGTSDISPEIGITGTPVIDATSNTLYLVAKTKETINGTTHFVQRLHAVNLADGTDRVAPFLIGDTTGSNTNSTPIYVYGSGDGSVTDPYNGTGQQVVQFNAGNEHQRGALSLVNNAVYVEWASHGDNGPYHGWVAKWDVSHLTTAGLQLTGVFNTSPNNGLAGIWQGGGQLTFEPDGSAFYFETGNGSGGAPTLDSNGFPTDANYNEALVKVVADPSTTPTHQNANGWGLKVSDYFIPYNVAALDGADSDFGSGAPLLLPDSAGIPGHPHLMVASGKEGKIYVIDRDNLGHFDSSNDHVLNAVPDGSGHNTPPVQISGSLSTPAFFNGKLYWVSGYSGPAQAFTINSNGILSSTSQTSVSTFGYLPGSVSVSANGSSNGIVWIMDRNLNQIHAYDASTLATELWNSGQKAGGADNLGAVLKFATPTVANGQVYVGTSNSLVVYGLTPPANAVPSAPTNLAATALSGSSVNLTWSDPTTPPNTATGYLIEQSTDGITFHQVTTAPAGTTSLAIGGLTPLTTYSFRIRGFNGLGDSAYSNTASATTTSQVPALDFSSGFAGSSSTLTYNGSAALNGTRAELTNGNGYEAGSVFSSSPVDVTRFSTQFSFQLSAGANTADGITFTIQRVGPTALGPTGGGLGYGPDHSGGTGGINQSVAIKFDLYNNQGEGTDSTGLYTNGAAPTNIGSVDLTGSGVDLHSGDVFNVSLVYDGTTLTETITDATDARKTFTTTYPIDIPGTVGGGLAYVGFTGGTGGLAATQDILSWTYTPSASSSPNAPSGLGATPASATSVQLNWTSNSSNQTGFHLDRATDSAFTQNLITETLPASPNAFTDTATGLAPGSTFYYRLRAYNSAGDSQNSNVASVTIPLAPPKPSNQQVTGVSRTEIDLSWQDNAGHQADGYKILRAINHGSFVQVASLPPTSRTPPSTYTWSDTGLSPGTYYEYHILAYNVSGNNDFAGVNATTLTDSPAGLAATGSNGSVGLSWSAVAGAVSYNVYRGTSAGGEGATPIATGLTSTTYLDSTVANGTTYYYKVTAVNGNAAPLPSESALSTEVSATPGVLLPDLTVSVGQPAADQEAQVGQAVSVSWTVTDSSAVPTSASGWYDRIYAMPANPDGSAPAFNSNTALYLGQVYHDNSAPLGGHQSYTHGGPGDPQRVTINTPGIYYLYVVADATNSQIESNENNHTAFSPGQLTVIPPAPVFTSPASTTFTAGTAASFTISTVGSPPVSLSESGALPGGVTFTDNHNGTATLAGTPVTGSAGSYVLTLTATSSAGSVATQEFTLNVLGATTPGQPGNPNLTTGPRAVDFELQTPFGPAGVIADAQGQVFEVLPSLGATIPITRLLGLGPSLSASVAFTSFGQVLVLTQENGDVLQITVSNNQVSIVNLTQDFPGLGLGKSRAASVAFSNGVEMLLLTDTQGNLRQISSNGSDLNLTRLLNLPPVQSATVSVDPFDGQEMLTVTDVHGQMTLFSRAGAVLLSKLLGTTFSETASVAFPGPDATSLLVFYVDGFGNLVVSTLQNGVPGNTVNLGPTPIG